MNLAEQVYELMNFALSSADGSEVVAVHGLVRTFEFSASRLKEIRPKVLDLARHIVTDDFLKGKGDGMSFLHLHTDREGVAWAEHPTMEAFLCLSIACRIAGYCAPRDIWPAFPGAVPYVWFDLPSDVGT